MPHTPPKFSSPDEERTHIKQRMAAAFRLFDRFGFNEGVAGHLTARDPERTDCFWVNPFAMSFGQIRASDLILVNHDGEVVEGDWPVNAAAFAIHSQVHAARPDVIAAAHTHSKHGRAWSTLGRLLDPITQDACSFFEDHGLFDDYTGVVSTSRRASASPTRSATTRPPSSATTACSPWATRVDEAAWCSSPWSAPPRCSCWPRPPARRC